MHGGGGLLQGDMANYLMTCLERDFLIAPSSLHMVIHWLTTRQEAKLTDTISPQARLATG